MMANLLAGQAVDIQLLQDAQAAASIGGWAVGWAAASSPVEEQAAMEEPEGLRG